MKKLLLILLLCLPLIAIAQSSDYYIYNIVSFEGKITKEGLKVKVDDGKSIEKLKDANGKDIKFNTPAAALMYFISQGWELCMNGVTEDAIMKVSGNIQTTSYWILRKPCSLDEFERAVEEGIRR